MSCTIFKKKEDGWQGTETHYIKDVTEWVNGKPIHKKVEGWETCEIVVPEEVLDPIISNPANIAVIEHATATFTVTASNYVSLQWENELGPIDGATGLSYTTPQLLLEDDQNKYRCIATNANGVEAISSYGVVTVTVTPPVQAPSFTLQPVNATAAVGGTATFFVEVSDYDSLQWLRDGIDISEATSLSYTTPLLDIEDTNAVFSCRASNSHHTTVSGNASLIVNPAPCTVMSGDAAIFLAAPASHEHTNSGYTVTMEDLPADKIFPDGQLPYVSGYDMAISLMTEAKANGFTVAGPHGSVYSACSKYLDAAYEAGLKYHVLIREMNTPSGGDRDRFGCYVDLTKPVGGASWCDDGGACDPSNPTYNKGKEVIAAVATTAMDLWMNHEHPVELVPLDDHIYGWMYCLDDCATSWPTDMVDYQHGVMQAFDPKQRTLSDFGLANSYIPAGTNTNVRMEQISNTIAQNYYHGGDFGGDGDGRHKCRMAIGRNSVELLETAATSPSPTSKPRAIVQGWLWGFAWNAVPEENSDADYFRMQFLHDILLSLMKGANGIHIYQLDGEAGESVGEERQICQNEYDLRQAQLFWALKKVNVDNDVIKALVWGKRTGHTQSITSTPVGSTTHTYGNNNEYTDDMLTVGDIQYKGTRYVVATNSMPTRAAVAWWGDTENNGYCLGGSAPNSTDRTACLAGGGVWEPGIEAGAHNPAVAGAGCPAGYRETWGSTSPTWLHGCPAPSQYDITSRYSGFPTSQVKITEVVSGLDVTQEIIDNGGYIDIELPPLGSAIFKVEPADGYCGGDQPEVFQWPAEGSTLDTFIDGIVDQSTLTDVDIDDSRWSNRAKNECYCKESASHYVYYFPAGGVCNFDLPAGTATVYDSVGGVYPGIVTGVDREIRFTPDPLVEGVVVYEMD